MVAAAGWLGCQDPQGQKQRLPDGTVLELVGVTFGTEHVFVYGNTWERLWDAVRDHIPIVNIIYRVPGPWRERAIRANLARVVATLEHFQNSHSSGWLDDNRAHFSTYTRQPVLWFRVHAHHGSYAPGEPLERASAIITDQRGCTFRPGVLHYPDPVLSYVGELPRRGGDVLEAIALVSYPHAEASFDFALFERQHARRLARFAVTNPDP